MDILFVTPEVEPFVKVGGLADMVGALAMEQARSGHRVIVALPGYRDAVLPPDWLAWAADVAAAPNDDARLALVESFLLPRWQAVAAGRPPLGRYRAWMGWVVLGAYGVVFLVLLDRKSVV